MVYSVKEIFYTLQGEGANTGRPAVFCRFSGCNLWTGREDDRKTAICQFCDTDFIGINGSGGGKFSADALAEAVASTWPNHPQQRCTPFVVCTGGEPLLQLDAPLVDSFHQKGFAIAIETNGTQLPPPGIDWICVSPKANSQLLLAEGNELKLVYPQEGAPPDEFESLYFEHFFLQPMDGPDREITTQLATQYCLEHPQWKLSLQTHKFLGIP
jgi:7-carboxy-7-deazaguanine synthase